MYTNNISDTRLHQMLRKYLTQNYYKELKGIKLCGSQVLGEVRIESNGEESRFSNLAKCHSAWACPTCTAKVMAQKGTDIACLIDALAKWENQKAFMVTFTIPHTKFMSCNETYSLLLTTWRMFTRAKQAKNSNGKSTGSYAAWRTYNKIDHFVRAYEFTYGENGWHPHIHVLYFAQDLKETGTKEWEEKLNAQWWRCAKHCRLKQLNSNQNTSSNQNQYRYSYYKDSYGRDTFKVGTSAEAIQQLLSRIKPDSLREKLSAELNSSNEQKKMQALNQLQVELEFADFKYKPTTGHRAVYFSRNESGNLYQFKSSHYVVGWGGDSELTANHLKDANNKHKTPFQILKEAQDTDNINERNEKIALFIEYALATRGHRRVEFTPNDAKIVSKWKLTNEYFNTIKKKVMAKETAYRVVGWLNKQQWSKICWIENSINPDIKIHLLMIAKYKDWKLLHDYLSEYNIELYTNEQGGIDIMEHAI